MDEAVQRMLEAQAGLLDQVCAPAELMTDPQTNARIEEVLASVRKQFGSDAI